MMIKIVVTGGYDSFCAVTSRQVCSNLSSKLGMQEQRAKLTET
jgi:hypothetical protein